MCFDMFKSKKKEKSTNSASSTYNKTTHVKSSNGGLTSTTYTREISQSSQSRSTVERTHTVHHSTSAGNFPQITSSSANPSLQIDALPWSRGNGSLRSPGLPSGSSRFPITGPGGLFETSSTAQPRLSLSTGSSSRSPIPPRTAFNSNTIATYRSSARPSPLLATTATNSAQNASTAQSVPAFNLNTVGTYRSSSIPSPLSPTTAQSVPAHIEDVPTYPINCPTRGRALLINNIKFIDEKVERTGAKKDSTDLGSLLRKIGFDVELKEDMKGKEMLAKVEKFSKTSFSKHDISMVVIMSHGNNIAKTGNRVKGGYTEIAGIDNVGLLVDDIIEKFTATNSHPSLKGKPKIFIFQCCRGEKDQEVCHDSAPIKNVLKDHSDILISYSTLPGYLSNRDPTTGSWYIQSICEVFERHYKDHHIEDMLKIVNHKLSKKHPKYTQTSTYESRGFNRCYLYPKGPN